MWNVECKMEPNIQKIVNGSLEEAGRLLSKSVEPEHLLLSIIRQEDEQVLQVLKLAGVDLLEIKFNLDKRVVGFTLETTELQLSDASNRVLRLMDLEARAMNSAPEAIHLLLAMLRDHNNGVFEVLSEFGVDYESVATMVGQFIDPQDGRSDADDEDDEDEEDDDQDEDDEWGDETHNEERRPKPAFVPSAKPVSRGTGGGKKSDTPALDRFGTDLTAAAAQGLLDPVVGREREIERVAQILCRRKKNNPILIGMPGVGKSAIVEGLAARIVHRKVARLLFDRRVIVLDMAAVVAGTKYRGQFEERLQHIIQELRDHPEIILFIDEIHTLIGAGSAAGTMDAANILKPALARGEVQCIGATTLDEFRKSIEKDGALDRRFQKVIVEPTSVEETIQILQNIKDRYEAHHNVTYTDKAIEACVRLTERYVTDRCLPDKAIDVMDEAGSRSHLKNVPISVEIENKEELCSQLARLKEEAVQTQNFELAMVYRDQLKNEEERLEMMKKDWEATLSDQREVIDETEIAEVVSMMTGIPVQRVGESENEKLRHLADSLKESVVGQDDAVAQLVGAIQRSRVGLKDPKKPIGTFMFLGPTGVGKTYLTKRLAVELFGSEDALIRIDMSEYMEKHTVSRMVGAPPGYVGYEEGGQLTERVRRKPYSIVLLDEIEKAHSDIFNVLLQVMDEGRMTDGNGTTVDFKNTIIIMTSNSGTRQLKEFGQGVGFTTHDVTNREYSRSIIRKSLQRQFSPEFLNRLDDIIFFDQLSPESILKIVDVELKPLVKRISDMGYGLELTDAARQWLAKKGYDVQYGARPLKRLLQTSIENAVCQMILDGKIAEGATIKVDATAPDAKEMTFTAA